MHTYTYIHIKHGCMCAVSFRFRFTFCHCLFLLPSFIVLLLQLPLFQLAFLPFSFIYPAAAVAAAFVVVALCVLARVEYKALDASSQPSHKTKIYNIRTSGFDPFGFAFIIFIYTFFFRPWLRRLSGHPIGSATPSWALEGESVLQINK